MLYRAQGKAAAEPNMLAALPAWVVSAGVAVAVGIAYFLSARLSLALLTNPDGVAVFWPAAGVSSGLLIGLGRTARIPIVIATMVATIAANMLGDRNLASAIMFAACNAAEAVIVAAVVERFSGPSNPLVRLRRVLGEQHVARRDDAKQSIVLVDDQQAVDVVAAHESSYFSSDPFGRWLPSRQ